MKKVLEIGGVDGCTTMWVLWTVHLKMVKIFVYFATIKKMIYKFNIARENVKS